MSFKHSFPTHNLWSIIKQIALLQMKQHSEILHKLNAICDILQCLLSTNNGNISCVFDLALVFERKSHILKSFQIDGEYFDSKHIFNGCMKTIHNALKTLQFDADEIQQITDILMAISNLSFIQFTSQSNVEHIDENNRFLWLNACKSLGNISIDALFDLFKSNDVAFLQQKRDNLVHELYHVFIRMLMDQINTKMNPTTLHKSNDMQNIHIIYTMAMQKDAQVDINANDLSKLIQNESHHQMIKFWMNHLSTHYTSNVAMNPDTMHGITPLEMALTNPMAVIKKKSSHSNAQRNTFHSFDITQSILTPQFRKQIPKRIITTNAQQMEPTQANNAFKVSYLKREVTYKVTADTVVNADRYLAPVIDLIHEHNTDLNDLQNCNYWDEVCTLWKMEHMKRISYGRRINPLYGYDQTLSFIQTLIQRMQYASSNALQNVWFVFHIGDNRSLIHDTMQKYGIYDVIESQIQTMDLTFEEHATDNDALKLFKPLASVKPKHDRNALLSNIRSKTRACNVEIDGFKNEIMYLFERMKEDIINDTVIIERISITHEQKLQSLQSDQVIWKRSYEELINTLEMKIKEHQINEEKMRDELAKIHRESIQKLQDTIADRDSLMTKLNSHNGITLQYDTKINDLMGKLKAVVTERDALREEISVLKERVKTRLEGKDEEISDFYIEKLKENEEEIIADLLNFFEGGSRL
eukprot:96900_1